MSDFDMFLHADPDAAGEGGTLDPPADGTYEVTLIDAGAFVAQNSGKTFIKTAFREVATGYEWTVLHGFKSTAQANVTKKTVRDMGANIDVTSLEELDASMKALVGGYFAVEVKTNGQYRNTYVNGPTTGTLPASDLTPADAGEQFAPAAATTGPTPDGAIPFRAAFPDPHGWRETRWSMF